MAGLAGNPAGGGKGREEVVDRHQLGARARLQSSRPAGQARDADAALEHIGFAGAQRAVVRAAGAGAAVIAQKQHQRVGGDIFLFETPDDPAHAAVERIHHGQIRPTLGILDGVVFGEQVRGRLERPVRRVPGHVEEEGTLFVAGGDPAVGAGGEKVRGVAGFAHGDAVALPVDAAVALVLEVVDGAVQVPVEMAEAARAGQMRHVGMPEVPFSDYRGLISGGVENVRHGRLGGRQPVGGPGPHHGVPQPEPDGVAARHEAGPRRRAERKRVEAVEAHPLAAEPVDVRRLAFAALVAQVLPAEVVGEEDHHVGALWRRLRAGPPRTR